MYRFKELMIGLDFTEMDNVLIKYTAFLSGIIKPDKIYFVNVQRNLDIPAEIKRKFPELSKPMDEKLRHDMQELVKRNFKEHESFDIQYKVIEGIPFNEMLRWSHIKNIDLLLVGRKQESKGSGEVSGRLAQKISCSVMFVPEKVNFRIKEILVPVDFSDNSVMALEEAVSISGSNADTKVYCHHIFELPSGYYTTGKTEKEFSLIMKEHAEEKCNVMLDNVNTGELQINQVFTRDDNNNPAALIQQTAEEKKVDLIITGAKGRTGFAAVLLGSVTEELIRLDNNIPLLVIKQKESTFNFFDAIKKI